LRNSPWKRAPLVARAAPTRAPARTRGSRSCHTMASSAGGQVTATGAPRCRATTAATVAGGTAVEPRATAATATATRATARPAISSGQRAAGRERPARRSAGEDAAGVKPLTPAAGCAKMPCPFLAKVNGASSGRVTWLCLRPAALAAGRGTTVAGQRRRLTGFPRTPECRRSSPRRCQRQRSGDGPP
jgi:hypothetical protein